MSARLSTASLAGCLQSVDAGSYSASGPNVAAINSAALSIAAHDRRGACALITTAISGDIGCRERILALHPFLAFTLVG